MTCIAEIKIDSSVALNEIESLFNFISEMPQDRLEQATASYDAMISDGVDMFEFDDKNGTIAVKLTDDFRKFASEIGFSA